MDLPPMSTTDCGMPNFGRPSEQQRQPARDAERGQRDDERMRDAAVHQDHAVHRPDGEARREHRADDQRPTVAVLKDERPDHRRKGQRAPDGQIDAAREDHQQLADRQTAMTADASRTLPMLPVVMNKGVDRLAAATIAASIKAGPARSVHRRAVRPEARDAPVRPPGPAGTEPGGSIEVPDAAARDSGL